jgi:hypothetical protein
VPTAVILPGLACGVLLAAAGLALWDGLRRAPGLSRAVDVNRWLAGVLLLAGALLAWRGAHGLSAPALSGVEGPALTSVEGPALSPSTLLGIDSADGPALHLILMAALAAPPPPTGAHRRRPAPWSDAIRILPALALAGAGLLWTSAPIGAGAGNPPLALVKLLGVIVCAGFGARALAQALSEITDPSPHLAWPSAVAYALLTLLVGGTALVNLWQRGAVWDGTAGQSGLAGAWLAWSAARLGPRRPARLRAGLIIGAALLLIVLAAGYPMLDV